MMNRRTGGPAAAKQATRAWLLGPLVLATACDPSPDRPEANSKRAALVEPKASVSALDAPAKKAGAPAFSCPQGRWKFDVPGRISVLQKEGEFVCDVIGDKTLTVTCATQGAPLQRVLAFKPSKPALNLSVQLEGKATAGFELIDDATLKVTSSDVSQLKVKATTTQGEKQTPFPPEHLENLLFGRENSKIRYKCEGDKLSLKPQLPGSETNWQALRAP